MQEVVIVDMARSAIGRHGGTIQDVPFMDLLEQTARAIVERNSLKIEPEAYDYVIMGHLKQSTIAANTAPALLWIISPAPHFYGCCTRGQQRVRRLQS